MKEHRFMCPIRRYKISPGVFDEGDIVRIKSLQSNVGNQINGLLAEILSHDAKDDRYNVVLTQTQSQSLCQIKCVALKASNLELHLALTQGARNCIRVSLTQIESKQWDKVPMEEEKDILVRVLQKANGKQIMKVIKSNKYDCGELYHVISSTVNKKQKEEVLNAGYLDWLFMQYDYPSMIDREDIEYELWTHDYRLIMACFFLSGQPDRCIYALKKMGPLILLVSNKKRRLAKKAECWHELQYGFAPLLRECLQPGMDAVRILMNMEPIVMERLVEHCILLLSGDTTVFLKAHSGYLRYISASEFETRTQIIRSQILRVLGRLIEHHPIHVLTNIGKTKVPSGVAFCAGVPFCIAFPVIIARNILEEIKKQPSSADDLIAEAQQHYANIYNNFLRCDLNGNLDDIDHEFMKLSSCEDFTRWANMTLQTFIAFRRKHYPI